MANQFPEVLPEVQSMPTTGWFCQTSGNARTRVVANTSASATEGIFNVKGVPGHTHNASAVVSVDADYTRYRDAAIDVDPNVWAVGAINMPAGLLTDSEEPNNQDERYDRAIEKCVGYMSLFPENCTGHIREPTRSISEIRTLVAPKARLDTLTYVDEQGGWRVPQDADDEKFQREALVSSFPDVHVSVMPRSKHEDATLNKATAPSSLFIDFDGANNLRYRVDALDADAGTIGWLALEYRAWQARIEEHAALVTAEQADTNLVAATLTATNGAETAHQAAVTANAPAAQIAALYAEWVAAYAAWEDAVAKRVITRAELARALDARDLAEQAAIWDNTLTFHWDPDKRTYAMRGEVIVVLNAVSAVYKAAAGGGVVAGAVPATGPIFDLAPGGAPAANHYARLTVTFNVMETSAAFDGSCWKASITNEEALSYAKRQNGLSLAPTVTVDILGAREHGPFRWVGMPAFRIPVGGKYAFPGPDILQEQFGAGDDADLQHNFYDKFTALTPLGLLRYQFRQQSAVIVDAAGSTPATLSKMAPSALNFAERAGHRNGALFHNRPGGFQKDLYAKQLLRDF